MATSAETAAGVQTDPPVEAPNEVFAATVSAVLECIEYGLKKGASDWHIREGSPIDLRCEGHMERAPLVSPDQTIRALQWLCASDDISRDARIDEWYKSQGYYNGGFVHQNRRFRAQLYRAQGIPCASIRAIDERVRPLSVIGVPPKYMQLIRRESGLIVVCGATGSGKSSTLNATIDLFNQSETREDRLVIQTVENPVEYQHSSKNCTIFQSDVGEGEDIGSFRLASKLMLRRDPDIVVFGEMLDLETVEQAMRLAGSGHLVFGTMHASTASGAIEQLLQLFPEADKDFYRGMLGQTLIGALAQVLVDAISGGRQAVFELLVNTTGVRNLICQGKPTQLRSHMESSRNEGMQVRDSHLFSLVEAKVVSEATALAWAIDPDAFGVRLKELPTNKDLKPKR